METLHHTSVPPPPLTTVQAGIRISAWLRQRDFITRALIAFAGLGILTALAASLVALAVLRQRTQFACLMPDGTIWLAEGTGFEDARELHIETALLATKALLNRGPEGFNFKEIMPRLFSPQTQALAEQLRQNEHTEFNERQWQQVPKAFRVEILEVRNASIVAQVSGQLSRKGPFAGQPLDNAVPFSLRLTFTKNRDLLRSRRHPLVVTAFTLTYEPAHP